MKYIITGTKKGKDYKSRKRFNSEKEALKYAYSNLVYNPSGNTKRKDSVSNISIKKI